jgi:aldehyde:ferredoxin oxidoreductase
MKKKVFISYSRKDMSFVKTLAKDLEDQGFDIWYDLTDIDASGLCVFLAVRYVFNADRMIWPVRLSQLMEYATGIAYSPAEVLEAADRVYTLERLFLLKAGSTEDTLPHRMLIEPLPEGPAKGQVNRLGDMLPEFYEKRGWDEKGWPTEEKLKELGLT